MTKNKRFGGTPSGGGGRGALLNHSLALTW